MGYIEDRKRELEKYLPPLTRKPDFDLFWEQSLEESRRLPLGLEVKRLEDYPAEKVHVYDISYQGMENTRIHGWYLAPRTAGGGQTSLCDSVSRIFRQQRDALRPSFLDSAGDGGSGCGLPRTGRDHSRPCLLSGSLF